jgi:excisionase family DNA binding protein
MSQRVYWKIRDLADYTGVAEKTLYSWIKNKKIPYLKLNGTVLFHIENTKRYLESKEVKPKRIVA